VNQSDVCAGSRRPAAGIDLDMSVAATTYGVCPACGAAIAIFANGAVRNHKRGHWSCPREMGEK